MRRLTTILVLALGLLLMTAQASLAQNAHFKKGGEPACTVSQSGASPSTTCSASLAGLGNGDLLIEVTVSGFAVYQCSNNGGNSAPGQSKVLVGPVTAPTTIPGDQIKNGNVSFTTDPAVLSAPDTVTGPLCLCMKKRCSEPRLVQEHQLPWQPARWSDRSLTVHSVSYHRVHGLRRAPCRSHP